MPIASFVQTIVDRSNCTSQQADECRRCTSQLIENVRDSSGHVDEFHRATVRLFVVATEPKMACEERRAPVEQRATDALQPAGKASKASAMAAVFKRNAASEGSALMANRTAVGDGLAMDALQPAGKVGDPSMANRTAAGGLAMMRLIVGPISDGSIDQLFTKYAYLFRSPGSDLHDDDRCFDASRIMSALRTSSGDDQYVQLAQMTAGFIYLNYSYPCRTPSKDIFLRQLFASYGSGEHLTRRNLSRVIDDLDLYPPVPEDEHDHEHGHAHHHERRRKRAVPAAPSTPDCFNLDIVLDTFAIDHDDDLISWDLFVAISPALIHQKLKCAMPDTPEQREEGTLTTAQKWGFGVLSVSIVSISSIFGVCLFPLVKGRAYDATLHFFIAMAVASLTGDAFFHLMPFFLGLHSHGHSHVHEEGVHVAPYFYKLLAANMAIFGFYLFELFLRIMWLPSARKEMEKKHELRDLDGVAPSAAATTAILDSPAGGPLQPPEQDDTPSGGKRRRRRCCGLTTITAMITLGDALHNFADGMAIAAAFSVSGSFGLSTSVAILCHEVPHELGDMAVYLSTGMGMFNTVVFNMLATITCFIGLFIGFGVAANSTAAQAWILAVTSGFFLYIALTDLLPALAAPAEKDPRLIVCHLFGFLVGAVIIIVIAVFEEQIHL